MSKPQPILEEGNQRLIRARHGYVLYNRNDSVIGRLIETYGEYFETEVDVFRRFLAGGDRAVDVGANIGTHCLAMARIVGPGGFVHAFEAQRIVFQTLCANIALNSLYNVHCVNAVVDDSSGWARLADVDPGVENNFGGAQVGLLAGANQAPAVRRLTLDECLDVESVQFIKIDVEGMEANVLQGAHGLLHRCHPVLYVENAYPDRSPQLLNLLAGLGYRCYWHLPLYLAQQPFYGAAQYLYPIAFVDRGDAHLDCIGLAVNTLCVHESHGIAIEGLRRIVDTVEHPLRRECVQDFVARGTGPGIPILRPTD